MTNQTLLIIIPILNVGGIARVLTELANYFTEIGYNVILLTLVRSENKNYFEIDERIELIQPSFYRGESRLKHFFYKPRILLFLSANIKRIKPYRILSLSDTFNPIVLLGGLFSKSKIFIGDVNKPERQFQFQTIIGKKLMYRFSAGFIAQTNHAAEFTRTKINRKLNIRVINSPLKKLSRKEMPKLNTILSVGRLSREKGQDRLIEAFALIKDQTDWNISLTSSGPFENYLRQLVLKYNIETRVNFLGRVDDIDQLYSQAKIFVLPSRMEGFPGALVEAMAHGLPVVCFDSFPSHEIITNNVDGIILKDNDIDGLSQTILRLIKDKSEREKLGANASRIRDRLSIEKIGNEFKEFMNL